MTGYTIKEGMKPLRGGVGKQKNLINLTFLTLCDIAKTIWKTLKNVKP